MYTRASVGMEVYTNDCLNPTIAQFRNVFLTMVWVKQVYLRTLFMRLGLLHIGDFSKIKCYNCISD